MKKVPYLYEKAFIIGSSAVVFLLPVLGYFISSHTFGTGSTFVLNTIPTPLPILLGLLNIVYFLLKAKYPTKNLNKRYWITGLIFGLLLASMGTFIAKLPTEVLGFQASQIPYVWLFASLTYGAVWRYIIKNLNHLFGLE